MGTEDAIFLFIVSRNHQTPMHENALVAPEDQGVITAESTLDLEGGNSKQMRCLYTHARVTCSLGGGKEW